MAEIYLDAVVPTGLSTDAAAHLPQNPASPFGRL